MFPESLSRLKFNFLIAQCHCRWYEPSVVKYKKFAGEKIPDENTTEYFILLIKYDEYFELIKIGSLVRWRKIMCIMVFELLYCFTWFAAD